MQIEKTYIALYLEKLTFNSFIDKYILQSYKETAT